MDFVGVPFITTAVLGIMEIYKKLILGTKNYEKLCAIIPILACIVGAGIGVLSFFLAPDYIPATTYSAAILIGAASGLSATGCNQIAKQLAKNACTNNNSPENTSVDNTATLKNKNKDSDLEKQ